MALSSVVPVRPHPWEDMVEDAGQKNLPRLLAATAPTPTHSCPAHAATELSQTSGATAAAAVAKAAVAPDAPPAQSSASAQPAPPSEPQRAASHTPRPSPMPPAEWVAQLVCYLWFANTAQVTRVGAMLAVRLEARPQAASNAASFTPGSGSGGARRSGHRPTASTGMSASRWRPEPDSPHAFSRAQLYPHERFISFVKNVLRTTQVSHSVMAVALLYIYRIKARHPNLLGQLGSEYRLFLTGLVLANKFLDDHTYTNKTWSGVSRVPLQDVNKMERQLWVGIGMHAMVQDAEFRAWLSTLDCLQQQRQTDMQWLAWSERVARTPSPHLSEASPESTAFARSSPVGSIHPMLSSPLSGCSPLPSSVPLTPPPGMDPMPAMKRKREASDVPPDLGRRTMPRLEGGSELVPGAAALQPRTTPTNSWVLPPETMQQSLLVPPPPPAPHPAQSQRVTPIMAPNVRGDWPNVPPEAAATPAMAATPQGLGFAPAVGGTPANDISMLGVRLSPYPTPHVTADPTQPLVLGYYQLAAGYPFGIPASRNVYPYHHGAALSPVYSTSPWASVSPQQELGVPGAGVTAVPASMGITPPMYGPMVHVPGAQQPVPQAVQAPLQRPSSSPYAVQQQPQDKH